MSTEHPTPPPPDPTARVLLGHGAGGRLSHDLVAQHFLPSLGNPTLSALMDSAVLGDLALTTDAYVVTPPDFPGGDLGRIAICGTVNDLAMVGAVPIGITAAWILEEGLPLDTLDRWARSMAQAARQAGVQVVAGDTKVVPRGACDQAFITTAGIGRLSPDFRPSPERVRVGDAVIVSGSLGDHGMAVMAQREGLGITGQLRSDVAPLNGLVEALRREKLDVHCLRDPTRGGAAQSLIEIATAAGVRVRLDERSIPVRAPVRAACELLGIDPLYVANEGKMLVFLPADQAPRALRVLRGHELGRGATLIGEVVDGRPGCDLRTRLGARRGLRMATGEILPRIC